MPKILSLLLAIVLSPVCGAEDTPQTESFSEMVERINQRYDDFFRIRREAEEREARIQAGRGERRRAAEQRKDDMEAAREAFVKSRKEAPSNESLRLKWEAEQKDRAAENEMNRRRHVQARDKVEDYLKKGRQIPELKEYDLEGY